MAMMMVMMLAMMMAMIRMMTMMMVVVGIRENHHTELVLEIIYIYQQQF